MSAIRLVTLVEVTYNGVVVEKNIGLSIDLDSPVDIMEEIQTLLKHNWFDQKDYFKFGEYLFSGSGNLYQDSDLQIKIKIEG